MFVRKLTALEYHSPKNFDYKDEKTFRNFISWIENQKIRLYKVEDRKALNNVDDPNWPQTFSKYLNDLQLSDLNIAKSDRETIIEQLLAQAIRYDYSDNIEKYDDFFDHNELIGSGAKSNDVLESINYTSQDFNDGLHRMQRLLNIPSKQDDNTSVLQAMSKLIADKLNPDAVKQAIEEAKKPKKEPGFELLLDQVDAGINTNDKVLNEAVKILRLLYIKDLRDLQTKINETIVDIQSVTANPKTDSSLGRVGR